MAMSSHNNSQRKKGQPTDPHVRRPRRSISSFTMHEICHLRNLVGARDDDPTVMALIYVHGSWNVTRSNNNNNNKDCLPKHCAVDRFTLLEGLLSNIVTTSNPDMWNVIGALQVDQSDDTYACLVGDDNFADSHSLDDLPPPPAQLPVLAIAIQGPLQKHSRVRYLLNIPPSQLLWYSVLQRNPKLQQNPQATALVQSQWSRILQTSMQTLLDSILLDKTMEDDMLQLDPKKRPWQESKCTADSHYDSSSQQPPPQRPALRIFVAGDRSSVGKSSVCLGLLGSLLVHYRYPASSLAYIKPATQCEAKQLIQTYCETKGIACRKVPGPLVYYKGFTRAYLAGETAPTHELLQECAHAVDEICRDKQVVVVDGVGFPAVGSICGTDNAAVLKACGYPTPGGTRSPMGVVIVGGSGVGAAVDGYNLNATYFRHRNIPIMGGIFNKLSTDENDFYSLEKCQQQVTAYFERYNQQEKAFGFVPTFPGIAVADNDNAMTHVDEFLHVFARHVNVPAILERAQEIQQGVGQSQTTVDTVEMDDCTVTITTTTVRKKPLGDATVIMDGIRNNHPPKDTGNRNKRMRLDEKSGTSQGASDGKRRPMTNQDAKKTPLTRDQIEQMAQQAGAAGSA